MVNSDSLGNGHGDPLLAEFLGQLDLHKHLFVDSLSHTLSELRKRLSHLVSGRLGEAFFFFPAPWCKDQYNEK